MRISSELSVLVLLTHTDSKSIQPKGMLKLQNDEHASIFPVPNVVAINQRIQSIRSEWTLLVSEFETVTEDVLVQIRLASSQSPATQVFFLQDSPLEEGYRKALSPLLSQLVRLSPFGLLFRTAYLKAMGGLDEKYSHAFDIALFLKLIRDTNPPIAGIPKETFTSIHNQRPAVLLGAARVRQATSLTEGLSGKTSSAWFAGYARLVEQKSMGLKESDEQKVKLRIRLSALASEVSHQIFQTDQVYLSPYLNRSIYDTGTYREQTRDVDDAVAERFGKPPQMLVLDESLHCFAIGQGILCAQVLRQLGLKRVTGPLDWINVSLPAVAHVIQSRFEFLVDRNQYFTKNQGGNLARAVENRHYLENFNLKGMFTYSDPREELVHRQLVQSVQVFLQALQADIPAVLVHLCFDEVELKQVEQLAHAVSGLGPKISLICVKLDSHTEAAAPQYKNVEFMETGKDEVILARLSLRSVADLKELSDPVDHLRLIRLIHGSVLGLHGRVYSE